MGETGRVYKKNYWVPEGVNWVLGWLPRPLDELVERFRSRRWRHKVEHDYRSTITWARRFSEEWLHQEAHLVAQVEKDGDTLWGRKFAGDRYIG